MNKNVLLLILILALVPQLAGCGNPDVQAGRVGYVTNEPLIIGEKGEFLGILVGPTSYGIGWCNEIKHSTDYRPVTVEEAFSNDAGSDTRILSKDQINVEVEISVVFGFKNAPGQDDEDIDKFKINARSYFENYVDAWPRRYSKPFREYVRGCISSETYESAKMNRAELSVRFRDKVDEMFEGTPFRVFNVTVGSINPPDRIQQAEERKAAAIVEQKQQAEELKLEKARRQVMETQADNLKSTLAKAPQYLKAMEIEIQRTYAEAFRNLATGEQAKTLNKVLFLPFGTPIAASSNE